MNDQKKKLNRRIKDFILLVWRFPYQTSLRLRVKKKSFTIFSQNCIGGVTYHDCGKAFQTPTINLSFNFKDFLKFCQNYEHYLNCELSFYEWDYNGEEKYPSCKLDDIIIRMVHYKNFEECSSAWNRRCKRIDYENIYIMGTDREGCTPELLNEFCQLPFENKVCFVSKTNLIENDCVCYIPEFDSQPEVGDLNVYDDIWGRRIFQKHFNVAKWLNSVQK